MSFVFENVATRSHTTRRFKVEVTEHLHEIGTKITKTQAEE